MITIREMTLADVDRVCVLEEMAFSMPWHKESFVEMIENKDERLILNNSISFFPEKDNLYELFCELTKLNTAL